MPGSRAERRRAVRRAVAGNAYGSLHAPRYAELLLLLEDYTQPGTRILDVGRSPFTALLHETHNIAVDNLGFDDEGATAEGYSYWFDLNLAQDERRWRRDLPTYDIVVLAEVIEHLHTAPTLVLRFLRSLVAEGGVLIVQTPNAVALHKRLQMFAGRNPYELIRENAADPGHFREYTRRELAKIGQASGFALERTMGRSYFDYRLVGAMRGRPDDPRLRAAGTALNWAYALVPSRLRPGQTVVLRKLSA